MNTLIEKIRAHGPTCSDFDDLIHDAADALASDANNGGIEGRVEFLKTVCGWSEGEILRAVLNLENDDE